MRLSLNVTHYSWPVGAVRLGAELTGVVRAAEDAAIDTVWVADHLIQSEPGTDPAAAMLEAYTTLGFLAARTSRVRLGVMVTAVTYRPPALLIKMVTTLDVLSGGRAWLGLGAGYQQDEAHAMGLPLPPTAERFEHLEDTLRLAHQMWAGDDAPFHGTHHHAGRPLNSPNALKRPHPPILIGGAGERRTLRLVAQYADACNLFDIPDGGRTIAHKLAVLAGHCEDVGRPYSDIEKTISTRLQPDDTPQTFIRRCADLAALGIDHVIVVTPGPWTGDVLASLTAAAPRVCELPTRSPPPARPE